jgi:hypothetical protein
MCIVNHAIHGGQRFRARVSHANTPPASGCDQLNRGYQFQDIAIAVRVKEFITG